MNFQKNFKLCLSSDILAFYSISELFEQVSVPFTYKEVYTIILYFMIQMGEQNFEKGNFCNIKVPLTLLPLGGGGPPLTSIVFVIKHLKVIQMPSNDFTSFDGINDSFSRCNLAIFR